MNRWFKRLDNTWRLVQRGEAAVMHAGLDGRDCYVFQRLSDSREFDVRLHVVPVEAF